MAVSDLGMRRRAKFYSTKLAAIKDAKSRKGVVIQVIRGRQWIAVSGEATIRESTKRMRESTAYLGKALPKIVADFRR